MSEVGAGPLLELVEHQPCEMSANPVAEVIAQALYPRFDKYVTVGWPSPANQQQYVFTPGPWVGAVPIDDLGVLLLKPKVPVATILGMMEWAYDLTNFEVFDDLRDCGELIDLYDGLARILAQRVLLRARRGLYRAYVDLAEELAVARGRLDLASAIRAPWRVKQTWGYQEHTADIDDNRIIAYTLQAIARTGLCLPQTRPMVRQAFRAILPGSTLTAYTAQDCTNRRYHRLNDDYRLLHALCRFFLAHTGPVLEVGEEAMLPFLIPMPQLFEQFVAAWLRHHLPRPYRIEAQQKYRITDDGTMQFIIDLVLYGPSGQPVAVLDTKYKRPDKIVESDLQQVLAYAEAKLVDQAILIYPAPLAGPSQFVVGKKTVRALTFDLDQSISAAGQALLTQVIG